MVELEFQRPDEGFRGVRWCTRRGEIPWTWSEAGFAAPCAQRQDEDLTAFGAAVDELTYTFRNSLLYGVRLDFSGRDQERKLLAGLKAAYPPQTKLARPDRRTVFWQTAETSVWLEGPRGAKGRGMVGLWGRHPMFADDACRPLYLARPPGRNSHIGAYQPRHYVCYRASGPIVIDGCLEEKAWRDAPWSQVFEDHQAPYAPPPWKTCRFKMVYDDDNLYIAAQLQEENVWGSLVERDCVIYQDNDFEVFLDASADGVCYYELELNPLNTVWDMFHETDYHRASALHTKYDIEGLETAVQVQGTLNWHRDQDVGWTVEIKWPLAALKSRNPAGVAAPKKGRYVADEFQPGPVPASL